MVVLQPPTLLGITAAASLLLLSVSALPAAIPPNDYGHDDGNRSGGKNGPSDGSHYYSNHFRSSPLSKESAPKDRRAPTRIPSAAGTTPDAAHFSFPDLIARDPLFPPFPSSALPPSPPPSFPSFRRPPTSPHPPPTQQPPFLSPGLSDDPALHRHSHDLVKVPPPTLPSTSNDSSAATAFAAAREQILHHCTTHFVALLDSEISDRLQVQLSRLVMMLPVLGVETRAQMRSKVVQVVKQQILHRLSDYATIHRIIETAIDDAGLLSRPGDQVFFAKDEDENDNLREEDGNEIADEEEETAMDRGVGFYSRVKDGHGENENGKEESRRNTSGDDTSDNDSGETGDDDNDDDNSNNEDTSSPWSRLAASFRRQRKDSFSATRGRPSRAPQHDQSELGTKPSHGIYSVDESQIPEATEAAMDAVLEYMAEILTPGLVIHQLTEAIQSVLYQIKKATKSQGIADEIKESNYFSGDMAWLGWDMDALEQMTSGLGQLRQSVGDDDNKGTDLLSDNWIWSGADIDSSLNQDDEDENESPSNDEPLLSSQEGEDDDIWNDDMEDIDWDQTGHLFDDFAQESKTGVSSTDSPPSVFSPSLRPSKVSSDADEPVDSERKGSSGDEDEGDEGEDVEDEAFSVGIRDENESYEDASNDGDDDDADGIVESGEDYEQDTTPSNMKKLQTTFSHPDDHSELFERLRQHFQKRFPVTTTISPISILSLDSSTNPHQPVLAAESAHHSFDKRSVLEVLSGRSRRSLGIGIKSDPRLEDLLTQLIRPLLVSFIEEDFPESCRRFQGELMDSIILALDQNGPSGSNTGLSEEDQLLLFAELGY